MSDDKLISRNSTKYEGSAGSTLMILRSMSVPRLTTARQSDQAHEPIRAKRSLNQLCDSCATVMMTRT